MLKNTQAIGMSLAFMAVVVLAVGLTPAKAMTASSRTMGV